MSVVVPAYNEALTIRDIASRALAQIHDVIVVDDGLATGAQGGRLLDDRDGAAVTIEPVREGRAGDARAGDENRQVLHARSVDAPADGSPTAG